MDELFNVCQFFEDGTYEYVRRNVGPEPALQAFTIYTNNPASKIGLINRVIITNSGDEVNMEWIFGKGITFPKPKDLA